MPTLSQIGLPMPSSYEELEDITCDYFSSIFHIPFQKWGRIGQEQNGIDLIGGTIGVQCKNYRIKKLTALTLEKNIRMAEEIDPPLSKLYIVTTAVRDVKIQRYIRQRKGKISVEIYYWDVIEQFLLQNPRIKDLHYPKEYFVDCNVKNDNENNFFYSQKQDYISVWRETLFLNRGEKDNEFLTLENIYVLPDYYVNTLKDGKVEKNNSDITLNVEIRNFITNNSKKAMIIYGGPGMGKSSLVNYIAGNEDDLNYYRKKFIYIGMQFLDSEIIQKESLLNAILKFLDCDEKKLENCVCILDGLDEIQSNVSINKVIEPFLLVLPKLKLKTIITSRDNILDYKNLGERVLIIELKTFDIKRIELFSNNYAKYRNTQFDIADIGENNIEIMGIPLLLYFVHALNLKISDAADKCKLYNKLFSGIYDKCRIEYTDLKDHQEKETNWGMPLMIELPNKMKEDFHLIAQLIALLIFQTEKEVQNIEDINNFLRERGEIEEVSKLKYPISNFYQMAMGKIKFAHRSFYEYFVSEYIFNIIDQNYKQEDSTKHNLTNMLKDNYINEEISRFLSYKFQQSEKYLYNRNTKSYYYFFEKIVCEILNETESSYNSMERACIFYNLLFILQILHEINGEGNYKLVYQKCQNIFIRQLMNYQQYRGNECGLLQLQYFDFKEEHLGNVDFSYANLSNAVFNGAILTNALLEKCIIDKTLFSRVSLIGTSFVGSYINRIKYNECILFFTNFMYAEMKNIYFSNNYYHNTISIVLDENNYSEIDITLKNSFIYNNTDFIPYEMYLNQRKEN